MTTNRVCPHPDCDRFLAVNVFACHRHYSALPRGLRERIEAAWRGQRVNEWVAYSNAALAVWAERDARV